MTPRPRGVRAGIRRFFRLAPDQPEQISAEIDDQIDLHLDLRTEQLIARGMTPDAARAEAVRRFGTLDRARPSLISSAVRREQRMRLRDILDAFGQDLRQAARALRNQPAFSAAVIITLALGIGANATMFGVVDRLLLRPPAYLHSPGDAGRVYLMSTSNGREFTSNNIAWQRYTDLRDNTRSFSETAAFFTTQLVVGLGEEARQMDVGMASASLWRFFDARPVVGRFFTSEEDLPAQGAPVAVLGNAYWRSAYGADAKVIGQQLTIGRTAYTIIGVAPPGFSGMSLSAVAAFIPINAGAADLFTSRAGRNPWHRGYNSTWMEMIARRKPGISEEAATADLTNAFRLSLERQRAEGGDPTPVDSLRPHAQFASVIFDRGPKARPSAKVATWLGGVSILVLLVACANVASLLLARAIQRRREIAVRIALGISRGRLVRYLLAESLLLALAGGIVAVLVAQWAGSALHTLLLPNVEWAGTLSDPRVLMFTAAASLAAGLVTGLTPALQHIGTDLTGALKSGGREGGLRRTRLRSSLIALQGAISVILLIGAGLFVRSLHNVRSLELGFDADRLLYVGLSMRGTTLDRTQQAALMERVKEHAKTLPNVETASITVSVPFWMSWTSALVVPGIDRTRLREEFYLNAVTPEYFAATGTPIIRGRGFGAADDGDSAGVTVVSQTAARAIWGTTDPIGQCVRVGADTMPCRTVVGIAGDILSGYTNNGPAPAVYFSLGQEQAGISGIFVRTRTPAHEVMESVRRGLQPLMPGTAFVEAKAVQDVVDPEIRPWRLGAAMFTLFGALALLLAAVGLFSVISYNVAQRTHELGVRSALGAGSRDVLGLVMREGLQITLIGSAIGIIVALFAGRYLAPLLYSVSAKDPLTFVVVAATLLAAAAAATMLPALRASRVDPNVVLRGD
jgi:predicted permease